MKGILWNGDFEASFIPHILKEIYIDRIYAPFVEGKKDLTIVDAGANVGLTTMYFSEYAEKVVAVEPSHIHYDALLQTVKMNELSNVQLVRAALSNEDGMATLSDFPGNATMKSIAPAASGWEPAENVPCITFKSLLAIANIDRIDLLKLDIEGAEGRVLRSSEFADVAPKIGCIVMELHSWAGLALFEAQALLERLGFAVGFNASYGPTIITAVRR